MEVMRWFMNSWQGAFLLCDCGLLEHFLLPTDWRVYVCVPSISWSFYCVQIGFFRCGWLGCNTTNGYLLWNRCRCRRTNMYLPLFQLGWQRYDICRPSPKCNSFFLKRVTVSLWPLYRFVAVAYRLVYMFPFNQMTTNNENLGTSLDRLTRTDAI